MIGMGPILGALKYGPGAFSLAKGLVSGGGRSGPSKREKRLRGKFDRMTADEVGRGRRLSSAYEEGAIGYDPQESINTSAQAAWEGIREQMGEEMESLFGHQVGAGRLDTGYGDQDRKRTVRHFGDRLNREIARNSMVGEELRAQNIRDLGRAGDVATDRGMEAVYGQYATERQAREQEAASKRKMWGNLGGTAISAVGRVLANYPLRAQPKTPSPSKKLTTARKKILAYR